MMRVLLPLLMLAACAPIPVDEAERQCLAGGTGGFGAQVTIDVSTDYLAGRDPAAVFDACVLRRSGNPPSRPLTSQPGWP
jgi:hypothetical protein